MITRFNFSFFLKRNKSPQVLKNNWRNLNLTLYNLHTLHHTSTALLVLTKKMLYISKHNLFKLFKSIIFKMMKKNSILILNLKKNGF